MTANGWFQIIFFLLVIFLLTKPLGVFMMRVFNREKTFLDPILGPVERVVYRLIGVDDKHEMRWTEYAIAMLLFSGVSMALLYLIERTQKWLPFNPQKFGNVEPGLAFGTAASHEVHGSHCTCPDAYPLGRTRCFPAIRNGEGEPALLRRRRALHFCGCLTLAPARRTRPRL